MHDDDDSDDKLGRIYYSGINPDADRADYALPCGEPALQGGDAEFDAAEKEDPLVSRRTLFAAGLGFAASSLVFFVVGLGSGSGTVPKSERGRRRERRQAERPAWLRELITDLREVGAGPVEELVRSYPTYVMIVEAYGGADPELWNGMVRLAEFVRLDRSERSYDIAQRMLESFETNAPPSHLRFIELELAEFVRVWEKTKR